MGRSNVCLRVRVTGNHCLGNSITPTRACRRHEPSTKCRLCYAPSSDQSRHPDRIGCRHHAAPLTRIGFASTRATGLHGARTSLSGEVCRALPPRHTSLVKSMPSRGCCHLRIDPPEEKKDGMTSTPLRPYHRLCGNARPRQPPRCTASACACKRLGSPALSPTRTERPPPPPPSSSMTRTRWGTGCTSQPHQPGTDRARVPPHVAACVTIVVRTEVTAT